MNNIFITIGIPFYNAEKFLADAVRSVLAQTYSYWELILVDDGSTDDSLQIAKEFAAKDNRIRIISDGLNKKLPARLNQIIKESRYDYIARMDADDLMHTERLEKQIKFLISNPQYDLVSTSIISIKNNNDLIGLRNSLPKIVTKQDALFGKSGIVHASILVRRDWYERNIYNEVNALAEDYELWLTAAIKDDLKVGFIPDYLYYYREEDNVTKDKMIKGYNTQIIIIKKYYNNIITEKEFKSLFYMFQLKKLIVVILNKLNLMGFLLRKRSLGVIEVDTLNEFHHQLSIIEDFKI